MELMVTMVVSLFGIMALMALHVSIAQGTNATSVTQEAISIGNATLEDLRTLRSTDMMAKITGNATSTPTVQNDTYATIAGRTQSYTVAVGVTTTASSANLWKLRVVVSWTDDGSGTAHTMPFEIIRTTQEAL
jgi:Tfp pilus assembly protein PilV